MRVLFLKGLSTAWAISKVVKKIWQLVLCGWSSSEKSDNNAWNVNASDGNMNNNNKDNNKSVSCLLALENKIIFCRPEFVGLWSGRVCVVYFKKDCRQL